MLLSPEEQIAINDERVEIMPQSPGDCTVLGNLLEVGFLAFIDCQCQPLPELSVMAYGVAYWNICRAGEDGSLDMDQPETIGGSRPVHFGPVHQCVALLQLGALLAPWHARPGGAPA